MPKRQTATNNKRKTGKRRKEEKYDMKWLFEMKTATRKAKKYILTSV